jgi:hypothetical protein
MIGSKELIDEDTRNLVVDTLYDVALKRHKEFPHKVPPPDKEMYERMKGPHWPAYADPRAMDGAALVVKSTFF